MLLLLLRLLLFLQPRQWLIAFLLLLPLLLPLPYSWLACCYVICNVNQRKFRLHSRISYSKCNRGLDSPLTNICIVLPRMWEETLWELFAIISSCTVVSTCNAHKSLPCCDGHVIRGLIFTRFLNVVGKDIKMNSVLPVFYCDSSLLLSSLVKLA